jgi:hypothetical protein
MGVVTGGAEPLDRRVALKVLPPTPRTLLREPSSVGDAAATAPHQHRAGLRCRQPGCHYFAMQFIAGQSLADLLGEWASGGRTAARNRPGREPDRFLLERFTLSIPTSGRWLSSRARRTSGQRPASGYGGRAAAHGQGAARHAVQPAEDAEGTVWVTDGLAKAED